MSATKPRLPAAERRRCVLDSAVQVFSRSTYRGATTAEIARECGVSEPVLYRHFTSKRDLYLACLDAAWEHVRGLWEDAVANEPDPALKMGARKRSFCASEKTFGSSSANWATERVQNLSRPGGTGRSSGMTATLPSARPTVKQG